MKEILKEHIESILLLIAVLIVTIGIVMIVDTVEKSRAEYIQKIIDYGIESNTTVEINY